MNKPKMPSRCKPQPARPVARSANPDIKKDPFPGVRHSARRQVLFRCSVYQGEGEEYSRDHTSLLRGYSRRRSWRGCTGETSDPLGKLRTGSRLASLSWDDKLGSLRSPGMTNSTRFALLG